ncbi:MAG: hypothetical protein RL226_66 [Bacteroidota bacterium]|jgi:iron complex outermembrane receptor protein
MKQLLAFCACFISLFAQGEPSDSIPKFVLSEASIVTTRVHYSALSHDTLVRQCLKLQSVGEVLQYGSLVNLRSYGPSGSLISGMTGGLQPDHLLVLWEGVPLNNPGLGMTDLSSLPSSLFETIMFTDRTETSKNPGGAAGVLELKSEEIHRKSFGAVASGSTMMNASVAIVGNVPVRKGSLNLSLSGDQLQNRFTFRDPYKFDSAVETQGHNDFERMAGRLSFYRAIGSFLKLETHAWIQKSAYEIPALLGSYKASLAMQRDSSLRTVMALSYSKNRSDASIRGGWFDEYQHYTDRPHANSEPHIDSQLRMQRRYVKADYAYHRGPWKLESGFIVNNERAFNVSGEGQVSERLLFGPQGRLNYSAQRMRLAAGARYDVGQGAAIFIPDGAFSWWGRHIVWNMNIGRIFRYPDLNELFWNPGGNRQLLPESGVTFRSEFVRMMRSVKGSWSIEPYVRYMEQMIMWVPFDGVYSAHNQSNVDVKGISAKIDLSFKSGQTLFAPMIAVNVQEAQGLSSVLAHFYPRVMGRASFQMQRKSLVAMIASRYSALNFRPNNLNEQRTHQDALLLFDVFLTYKLNNQFTFASGCLNVANIMDYRTAVSATPGRVLNLTISWKWNQ